ncbi:hypothetical protein GGD83_004041 [Rhodoblastus sphagnicola]|nr:hypothetical protein [Rhodoblastus sphagnicola]MBB4200213.1 hypothetical protein [Rhodoblastus sphagnicola]
MKRTLPFLVLVVMAQPAVAEFSFVSNEIEVPASPDTSPAPQVTPSPARKPLTRPKHHASAALHRASKPAPKTVALVSGFGAQVPLAFAIRQMVPDGYEIILEPPADPNTPVDWQGGKSWMQALASAVKPLGLSTVVHDKTITIRATDNH